MHWAKLTTLSLSLLLLFTTIATTEPAYPPIPLEGLDNYPTLKLLAALLTVLIPAAGALLYLKASYFKPKSEAVHMDVGGGVKIDAANVMFYQGPLKAIYDLLTDIRGRQGLARGETREDIAQLLSQSRQQIDSNVGNAIRDLETRAENRFRDVRDNVNSVHERIDEVNANLIRVATLLERRE